MAATYAPSSSQGTAYQPIFLHRFNKVLAAARFKAAATAEHGANQKLIQSHEANQR
jgi:hypothetical protein